MFGAIVFISIAGILTMNSFGTENGFFWRQIIWLSVSSIALFVVSTIDWRFLRRSEFVMIIFGVSCFLLLLLFLLGSVYKGAQSWFNLGSFAFQPVDFVKISVILLLAKYFSRRHVEIANIRHIIVSGFYAFLAFILVFLQPDFGSAIIIFLIWFSMIVFSGVSKKHLAFIFSSGIIIALILWFFVFEDYQKARIVSFVDPLSDLSGAGYNAYQSTIAVGSGEVLGKGLGLGSQSKLKFLPEYETDFIFAAFSEEWGFVGVIIIFTLYGIVFWKLVDISKRGSSNFETFYGLGLGAFLLSHFVVNVGMNIGLMPITGITLPFMSYGGSHLLAEFVAVGILMSHKKLTRSADRQEVKNEIVGVV
jgi:rod shape determining protein RodA